MAVECYADEDVIVFARDELRLDVRRYHSFSQSEVIKDVFIRNVAPIGMVDEDPGKPHHRLRDQMQPVFSGLDLELRRRDDRHLIIVKPDLEECFLRALKRVGLTSSLGSSAGDLQAILNLPRHPKHKTFQNELALLYRESREKHLTTFATELEDILSGLLQT